MGKPLRCGQIPPKGLTSLPSEEKAGKALLPVPFLVSVSTFTSPRSHDCPRSSVSNTHDTHRTLSLHIHCCSVTRIWAHRKLCHCADRCHTVACAFAGVPRVLCKETPYTLRETSCITTRAVAHPTLLGRSKPRASVEHALSWCGEYLPAAGCQHRHPPAQRCCPAPWRPHCAPCTGWRLCRRLGPAEHTLHFTMQRFKGMYACHNNVRPSYALHDKAWISHHWESIHGRGHLGNNWLAEICKCRLSRPVPQREHIQFMQGM